MLNINNNLVGISKIDRFLFFHVNHIPQAIQSELICFHMPMIRAKNLITVEGQVNKTLASLHDWFFISKLNICLSTDKIK